MYLLSMSGFFQLLEMLTGHVLQLQLIRETVKEPWILLQFMYIITFM